MEADAPKPSFAVAVMTAVPSALAIMVLFWFTDTTLSSVDVQTTVESVAFVGNTDTDSAAISPNIISLSASPEIVMEVTGIAFTVIVSSLERTDVPLYTAVAVILAVPAFSAVTIPLALSTDAISGASDSHVITA